MLKLLNPHKETQRSQADADAAPSLPSGAVSYIGGVIGVTVLASVLAFMQHLPTHVELILVWTLAVLAGELMTFPTATNRAHINLATTVHLAMIVVLPLSQVLAVMWLSRSIAKFIIHRQVWYRALFNVAQATAATLGAALVYQNLGGAQGMVFTPGALAGQAPAFLAAALTYYTINTLSVAGVVALTSKDTFFRAWRENYGYAAEIVSTLALVLLAPIAVLCYQNLNWIGLTVFLFPMLFIRASSVRYIALRQAQQHLIASERLAAKGEIAAEVGHEINNYLTGVYGQLQLILMKGERQGEDSIQERLSSVLSQLDNISTLSQGLVDFSHKDTRFAPTPVVQLVENTVAFLKPQNRFDRVDITLDLDPRVADVPVDPGQIQQAVMNILINAANAMEKAGTQNPRIDVLVRLHDVSGQLEITVADSGPGVPVDQRGRIFEPGFTTHEDGHGFGLSTTHRIVANHQGSLEVGDSDLGGALFRILLPLQHQAAA